MKPLLSALLLLSLAGCSAGEESNLSSLSTTTDSSDKQTMKITINNQAFSGTLTQNPTTQRFVSLLPTTLEMTELNGNEKYAYLPSSIREDDSQIPALIKTGDLMLFGDNCLVLFYQEFTTTYSYVSIGHFDVPDDFSNLVGSHNITVLFTL